MHRRTRTHATNPSNRRNPSSLLTHRAPPPFSPCPPPRVSPCGACRAWCRAAQQQQQKNRAYDECDLSAETLGTPYGDKEAFRGDAGAGGAASSGGGDPAPGTGAAKNKVAQYDRSRFHVHLGAGRLGLGLVVGSIAESKTPFGVVQRPKASWGEIISNVGCRSSPRVVGAVVVVVVVGVAVAQQKYKREKKFLAMFAVGVDVGLPAAAFRCYTTWGRGGCPADVLKSC